MSGAPHLVQERPQKNLVPAPAASCCSASGRLPFAFGRRFYVALLAGLIWLGPAWSDKRFLAGMFLWDAIILGIWLWDLLRLTKPRDLELMRFLHMPAALSTPGSITLELRNHGAIPILAQIVDDAPGSVCPEPPHLEMLAGGRGRSQCAYPVMPRVRGDARFGMAFLRYTSPWKIAELRAYADLAQTVRVYANLEEARRQVVFLIRSRQVELEKRLKRLRGRGREFVSLREYHEGDEIRDICWTATARRNAPVSKIYQVERSQAVWVSLDAGRLMRARVGELSKLDFAVNATLSLAHIVLHSGDRFGLMAYGRQPQQRLNAGRGPQQLRTVVESLALVRGEASEADHLRAARWLLTTQKQRSLIAWVTDLSESAALPDVVESAILLARRHFVVFLVIGNQELTQEAARRPATPEEMYRCAAAAEIVHRREVLLGQLRQQGVMALELEAKNLTTTLMNQYLEAKERGRI